MTARLPMRTRSAGNPTSFLCNSSKKYTGHPAQTERCLVNSDADSPAARMADAAFGQCNKTAQGDAHAHGKETYIPGR